MDCNELFKAGINVVIAFGTVVALVALIHQWKKDNRGIELDQASKISCWIDLHHKHNGYANNAYSEYVRISNCSNQPIYDAIIIIDYDDNKVALNPSEEYYEFIAYIPPGEYRTTVDWICNDNYSKYNSAIFFRDILGKYWFRNGIGRLYSVTNDEAKAILSVPTLPLELQRIMEHNTNTY